MKKILLGCVLVSGLFANGVCDMYVEQALIQLEKMELYTNDKDRAGGDRAFRGLQFALNEGIPNCTGEKKAYLLKIKEIMKEWK